MGKVKDKILKEAQSSKEQIEKEASSKVKKIIEDTVREASDIEKKGKHRAEEEGKTEMERILSMVRMELSNMKLDRKNKIIGQLKEKVTADMKSLKWEEYKELIKRLILSASTKGDEEIIPGALHGDKIRELIDELNREDKHNFKISDEKGDFEVGVVLSKASRRVNARLSVLLEETFDEKQEEIVRILFK